MPPIVVTSRFNPARRHPLTGKIQPHNGTDYRAATGTPIYAMFDGTVTRVTNAIAGNRVHLAAGNTRLGHSHLSKFGPASGSRVTAGQIIGYSGDTGSATAPHLHFDVQVNGKWINPEVWLKTRTGHPLVPNRKDDDVALSNDDIDKIANAVWRQKNGLDGNQDVSAIVTLRRLYAGQLEDRARSASARDIAAEVIKALPARSGGSGGATPAQVEAACEKALRSVFGSLAK